MTNPSMASTVHAGRTKPSTPPVWVTDRAMNTAPASVAATSATTMIRCGVNRRSSTTLNCVAAMSAIAPAPNTSAKLC